MTSLAGLRAETMERLERVSLLEGAEVALVAAKDALAAERTEADLKAARLERENDALRAKLTEAQEELAFLRGPSCRVCGCTEHDACEGGCSWIEGDLCSKCEGKAPAASVAGGMTVDQVAAVELVLVEVEQERFRQHAKWGQQDHPSFDQELLSRPGGCTPVRMSEHYEIPSEARGKFLCDEAARRGQLTYAAIAIEELSEVVGSCNAPERATRSELVQTAAVLVAWIEAIDRRSARAGANR